MYIIVDHGMGDADHFVYVTNLYARASSHLSDRVGSTLGTIIMGVTMTMVTELPNIISNDSPDESSCGVLVNFSVSSSCLS